MAIDRNVQEAIGFWNMVLQPNPSRDRAKVWLDGDSNYQLFSIKEIIDLARMAGLEIPMREVCREYSFFLWEVATGSLRRIAFKEPADSLRKEINDTATPPDSKSAVDHYWRHNVDISDEASPKINV